MQIIKGNLTTPKGFKVSSLSCGLKESGKHDLALLSSDVPCISAGTFTVNKMKSGSVVLTQKRISKGIAQAMIVNSGNANACVGKQEIMDAEDITKLASEILGIPEKYMLIASTGIIGRKLPVEKIKNSIGSLVSGLSSKDGSRFSKAIMTTDTVQKEVACTIDIGSKRVTIAGVAKGAGMICPNMATMLSFCTTDAAIEKAALEEAFKNSVYESFNTITVDGDMSTNDTAIVLANGLAGNDCIKKNSPDHVKFLNALKYVAKELARKIILDGEGATRFVDIFVKGAKTDKEAALIAKHVASSSLTKTMIAGGDPNWGRIAASIGSSGADISKEKTDIYFGKYKVMDNGTGTSVPRAKLADIFAKKEINIVIDLKRGKGSYRAWTCDLTEEYVRINAEYET